MVWLLARDIRHLMNGTKQPRAFMSAPVGAFVPELELLLNLDWPHYSRESGRSETTTKAWCFQSSLHRTPA